MNDNSKIISSFLRSGDNGSLACRQTIPSDNGQLMDQSRPVASLPTVK